MAFFVWSGSVGLDGRIVHRYATLPSTQDVAHELAGQGAPSGTVVVATTLSGGRGTRGNRWSAPPGGLWLSVLVRPDPAAVERLSLRVGLEIAESLSRLIPPERVELKWPNDLVVRHHKVGGILTEARWSGDRLSWVIVGVGLNVTNPVPPDTSMPAIGLVDVLPTLDLATLEPVVIEAVIRASASAYQFLTPEELDRFAARDWLAGRPILTPDPGVAAGIFSDGRLRVVDAGGAERRVAGPITVPGLAPGARLV